MAAIIRYDWLWMILGIIGIMSFTPSVVGAVLLIGSLLLLFSKGMPGRFLLVFIALLLMADNRDVMFEGARLAKPVATVLLGLFAFRGRKEFRQKILLWQMLPFLLLALVHVVFSEAPMVSLQKTLSLFIIYMGVPLVFLMAVRRNPNFIRDLGFGLMVFFWSGLILYIVSPSSVTLADRYYGFMGNPNGMGLFSTVMLLVVLLTRRVYPDAFTKRFFWFLLLGILLSLIMCKSRTALLCTGLYLAFSILSRVHILVNILAFVAVVFYYGDLVKMVPVVTNELGLGEELRAESTEQIERGSGREVAWAFAWQHIQESPIQGRGVGYTESLMRSSVSELSALGHQGNVHNSYLTLWLDTGIVGLISFFLGMFFIFLKGANGFPYALPILFTLGLSAYYESWMASSLNPVVTFMVMMMTMMLSASMREEDEEQEEASSHSTQGQVLLHS